jgi:Arc/MetJ-type ribon-helix-helix transcriptional regulator
MPRLTVTIDDDQADYLDAVSGDGGEYASKSAAVRAFIQAAADRDGRVERLEQEVDRLRREKRQLLEEREEKKQLANYVETEREVEQRWRQADVVTRMKWRVFGMPDEAAADG